MPSDDLSLFDEPENQPEEALNADEPVAPVEPVHDFNSGVIRKTETFDLFISYKRDNGEDNGQVLAEMLYDKLTADGYRVWLDNQEIGFSSDYEMRLEQAILHSKKVACVIGPAWVNSVNCQFELKKSVEFEKRIIPLHYQTFRKLLNEKKANGEITEEEWRRVDKPQEVDFSAESKYKKAYSDLKALCRQDDLYYERHTKILCEAYYWESHKRPKSMLLRGDRLAKVKLIKKKCDSDENYPTFSVLQNEFVNASEQFVSTEVSNKRKAYISYPSEMYGFAAELNMELKLHNISTWFEEPEAGQQEDEKSFIEAIISCENLLDIVPPKDAEAVTMKATFARSNSKRVLRVTDSERVLNQLKNKGEKNVHYWEEQVNIAPLITTINGDKVYNAAHSKLLEQAFQWEQADKSNSKLLPLNEAKEKEAWYKAAEKSGAEPQPNTSMVDYVERSLAHGLAIKKRKKMARVTTVIGLAIGAFLAVMIVIANNKREAAQKEAKQAKNEANKARDEKEEAKQAAKEAAQAKIEADSAANKAKEAKAKAEQDKEEAQAQKIKADEAKAKAQEDKDEAEKGRLKAKQESDSINTITKGKVLANRALEYIQLSQLDSARSTADNAVVLLTDSVKASANVQSLYRVYYQLLPRDSPLSQAYRQNNTSCEGLTRTLFRLYGQRLNHYEPHEVRFTKADTTVKVAWNSAQFDKDKLQEWIDKMDRNHEHGITAMTLSADGQWMAVGFRSGLVTIYHYEFISPPQDFGFHSYRITSLAFNPSGTQLAIASVDERFTLLPLNGAGMRDETSEVIVQENGVRANEVYYWNANVLVTKSWEESCKAWGTNVSTLKNASNPIAQ